MIGRVSRRRSAGPADDRRPRRDLFDAVHARARRARPSSSRCCWSSRTCTGPTSRPATCSASCSPAARRTGSRSSRPTAATTCTAGTRCAPTLAEWGRLPARHRGSSSSRCATPTCAAWSRRAAPRADARGGGAQHRRPGRGQRVLRRGAGRRRRRRGRLPAVGRPRRPAAGPARPARRRRPDRRARAVGGRPPGRRTSCSPRSSELGRARARRGAARGGRRATCCDRRAADGYAFRHALLAEAVYDDLLPGERVRLHAGYADGAAVRAASTAPPPSSPGTPAPPTTWRPRSAPASGPATRP